MSKQSTHIVINRFRTESVYRIAAAGAYFSIVPLCIIFGVIGLFTESSLITFNDEPLPGVKGLIASPFIGLFIATIITLMGGTLYAAGLWLYSRIGVLSLRFYER